MGTVAQPIFDMSKAKPIFDMSKATPVEQTIQQKYGLPDEADLSHGFMSEKNANLKMDPIQFSKAYAEKNPPPPAAKGFLANMWGEAKNIVKGMSESEGMGTASAPPAEIPGAGLVAAGKARYEQAKTDLPGALGATATDVAAVAGPIALAKGVDMLPSAERAGASLAEIKGVAGKVPIDMARPGNTALELYEQSQKGATLPKVVRDFVNRATKPDAEPITYADAKDFQSNVSSLSADEKMKLKGNTKRLLGQLNSELKDSLESAADTQGKGEQFTQAMQEYHHAMQLKGFTENAIKVALGTAATAAGLGFAKKVWDLVP